MRLDGDDLAFLARFATTPDAKRLCEILQGQLTAADVSLRSCNGEETFRAQGRAQQLAKLLEDITGASMKLQRSKPSPEREFRQVSNL